MAGKPRYNWDTIRRAYVSGEMDLIDLAKETTGRATDPPYQSIRRAAITDEAGKWEEQRRAFRNNLATQTAATPTAQAVVQQTEQLVDSAEAIARHIQLAKSLQGSYAAIQAKLKQLRIIEQMDFTSLDPMQLSLLLQRLSQVIATAADIERKALGISDPKALTETEVKFVVAMPDESSSIEQWSEQWSQALKN